LLKPPEFAVLFAKLMDNACSPEEVDQLMAVLSSEELDASSARLLREQLAGPVDPAVINEGVRQRLKKRLEAILSAEPEPIQAEAAGKLISYKFWRYAAAAAIAILLGTGVYTFINHRPKNGLVKTNAPVQQDITAPISAHALITLANGKQIALDSVSDGTLATEGNADLVKTADGQIVYNQRSAAGGRELVYNTLIVPRGSKIVTLTLADGSKVWMNSGSSLRYPVSFMGSERRVEITGEAYFEVAHDPNKKFYVAAGNVTTEVLGTRFNVNAYSDEGAIKVTLLEGSVKVVSLHLSKGVSTENVVIKPGQQAEAGAAIKVNSDVDMETVMAWKNGLFQMKGTDLASLMRQISRWYDVQVHYEGPLPQKSFGGSINRDVNLSDVMKALEQYGIRSRMEKGIVIIQ
jgi:transmembrane sensor